MKLTFISNACCIYESQGKRLLADPWLVGGAFCGSWFHSPPLKTKPQDVADCDYLYISHVHPDHYCKETLKVFRRDIPIVILDLAPNILEKNLIADGFTNLVKLKDWESCELGPFKLTIFKPFVGHPFHDTEIGNLIDSALMVEADGQRILNTNDNTPSVASAQRLKEHFGCIDVAQLNYNAAGPYPACFAYTDSEKLQKHGELLFRNLTHMMDVAHALGDPIVQPFAGAYVLGGRLSYKNQYLGTTTQEKAAEYLKYAGISPLVLNEGETYELVKYCYDDEPAPDKEALLEKMRFASFKFKEHKERLGISDLPQIVVNKFIVYKGDKDANLICELDPRLLNMILDKREHWNNAEIGCHIEFEREPDVYSFDAHMLLNFFHL